MTGISETAEAMQSIAEHLRPVGQTALAPIDHRDIIETLDRLDHGEGRMFQALVGRHGNHEWLFVLRATTGLATIALAAQIGVVHLNKTRQLAGFFTANMCNLVSSDLMFQHKELKMEKGRKKSAGYAKNGTGNPDLPPVPILAPGIGTRIGQTADLLGARKNAYEIMGISSASLQRWMHERSSPEFGPIARLCAAAGVRMEWIAFDQGPMRAGVAPESTAFQSVSNGVSIPPENGEVDLLGKAIAIASEMLVERGIRQRFDSTAFSHFVQIVFGDLTQGRTETEAGAGLARILDMARKELSSTKPA